MNRGGSFDEIRKRVTGILSKQREPMERISPELIRKETLERAELDSLLAVRDGGCVRAHPVEASSDCGFGGAYSRR